MRRINPLKEAPALVLDDGANAPRNPSPSAATSSRFIRSRRSSAATRANRPSSRCGSAGWNSACSRRWRSPFVTAIRRWRGSKSPQMPQLAEHQRPRAQQMMRFLDEELASRRFIASDDFTIADITAIVAMDLTKLARVEIPRRSAASYALARGSLGASERRALMTRRVSEQETRGDHGAHPRLPFLRGNARGRDTAA